MRRTRAIFIFILIPFISIGQQSDSAIIKKISDEILIHGQAYENLRFLCKKVGARLSGSPQAAKAVRETARMLKEAGADTVYLQPCMVTHWVRGEKEQGVIQWGTQKKALHVCALGMSVGTPASGIRAGIIEVRNFEELYALGAEKVKGKIVFFNYPMRPELISGGYRDAVVYRGRGPVEAAKLGAVAIMIRSVTHALDNNPHTGATQYDSSVKKIPAIACSTLDAEWLHQLLQKEKGVQLYMKMNCQLLPDAHSFNVIGEIRGSEQPEEIITVGGHLDSWDLAEGAHDDGTGCMQAIEVIRTLKALGLQPKRTIRAVMFMNEENGLGGGRAYAAAAKKNNEQQIFACESDEGGFGIKTLGINGTPEQEAYVRKWLPLFSSFGVYKMPDGGGGADIGPLRSMGTMMSSVNPESQLYFNHHHAPNDVFEAVDKRELELGAIGMTSIAWLVSKYGIPPATGNN
ncbi:MAG: M20/M25/M40 family metallo-hydrolase [Terrimonas sp.]|nr:M20/M25/M40 family metallo-hydrolase [Terrimonas sp.]